MSAGGGRGSRPRLGAIVPVLNPDISSQQLVDLAVRAEQLGFDACISRLSPSFAQDLQAACPDGIDIYFENVGGPVFDAVLPLFRGDAQQRVDGEHRPHLQQWARHRATAVATTTTTTTARSSSSSSSLSQAAVRSAQAFLQRA